MFRKYAITGNQGNLEINANIRFHYDADPTEASDTKELASDGTEKYLTPTELGK